jgi:hypothetical protein
VTGAKVRPLYARPGARFACAGDGLCCTDLHLLGPLSRGEVAQLRAERADATVWNERIGARVLKTVGEGACTFLATSDATSEYRLDASSCTLHARLGPEGKPASCRRFPYRLVATPLGGRVVTEHRCPCRSLGERPPLDLRDAERSLTVSGRLQADARVGATVRLTARRRVPFESWVAIEHELLAGLQGGAPVAEVLGASPFPALEGVRFSDVGHLLRSRLDGTACSVALAWFGDVLLGREGTKARRLRDRPWALAFDRGEARAVSQGDPAGVLRDWLCDELWSLDWVDRGPFDRARAELSTRFAVAELVTEQLVGTGARPDRAAAEAVAIAELTGASPLWRGVVAAMRP